MEKIVCFGELLLRFSPFDGCFNENYLPVYVGGAELNVCTALSGWNVPAKYVTALPDNYLAQEIIRDVQKRKIDTSSLITSGNRIGTYYLQQGTDLKHAGVIYDRAYSSFYDLKPGQIDWDKVLDGASWFHFSAISPALNENVTQVCEEGLKA
ncbi:MAG: PfkB family carbohydrate kinase, partial [Flavitalea sp.]